MTLFAILYFGLVGAFLGWGLPLLDSRSRRILFGLTAGLIAAAALPFAELWARQALQQDWLFASFAPSAALGAQEGESR